MIPTLWVSRPNTIYLFTSLFIPDFFNDDFSSLRQEYILWQSFNYEL